MLTQDRKHVKVTLEDKGVVREDAPIPELPPLPVPHRVSA